MSKAEQYALHEQVAAIPSQLQVEIFLVTLLLPTEKELRPLTHSVGQSSSERSGWQGMGKKGSCRDLSDLESN